MSTAPCNVRVCGLACGLRVRAETRTLAQLCPIAFYRARGREAVEKIRMPIPQTKRARAACNACTRLTARTPHTWRGSQPAHATRTLARTAAHSRARLTHLRVSRKKG
jgi:hypothetical protein